jgi:excisionase family DNA binding protein
MQYLAFHDGRDLADASSKQPRTTRRTLMDSSDFDSIPVGVEAISTRVAAQRLGCTQANVRKLVREGRIHSWLLSRRLSVVDRREVNAFAERQEDRRRRGVGKGPAPKGFKPDRVPAQRAKESAETDAAVSNVPSA